MRSILDALPQRHVIDQTDAVRWVEGVLRHHPERAEWHAKRLLGLGGSEIGAVVSYYRGESHTGFHSIADIVQSKLMKRLPGFENSHMRRGNRLENLASRVFMLTTGFSPDGPATRALAGAEKRQGYEFVVGNQDEIVVGNGKRFMVDYKVPNVFSESVEFDYVCQLHHYTTMANLAGIRIDGLIIAKLDLPPQMSEYLTNNIEFMSDARIDELARSIARMNTPGCRIVPLHVEIDKPLQSELLAAGKDCWNDFVLTGSVPLISQRGKLELTADVELKVAQYQQQYLMAKSGISYLNTIAKSMQENLQNELANVDIFDKELPLSVVTVRPNKMDNEKIVTEAIALGADSSEIASAAKSYSVSALIKEIQTLGGKTDAPHLYEASFDVDKATSYLKDRGVDMNTFRKEGLLVELSRKKADKQVGAIYENAAAERFSAWIDESLISNQGSESEFMDDEPDFEPYLPVEMDTGHLSSAFAQAYGSFADDKDDLKNTPMRAQPGLR